MSIKENVIKLQAAIEARNQARRQAEEGKKRTEQTELIRRLKVSERFLAACNAEEVLKEVNSELLSGGGIIELINGIFVYRQEQGTDFRSMIAEIETPVVGINLTWQRQGSIEGIFVGVNTDRSQIRGRYEDYSLLEVFCITPASGDEAAEFLNYPSFLNPQGVASVSSRDETWMMKSKRQLRKETEYAVSIAVVEHINRGNIEQPN